ncbi:mu-type opioid receptor-like [Carcharodon carcharias]|uniref:mu-type opioid receptor-like n=1 Tax=Carcharodon carcharias TaxID=13397 RepID=UPI001B7E608C|nr:mu-type opioid receptor-like [Carcharodon carcharias]
MALFEIWNVTVTGTLLEINSTIQNGNTSLGASMGNVEDFTFMIHVLVITIFLGPCFLLGITANSVALWHIKGKKISSPTDVLLLDLIIMNIFIILASAIAILKIMQSFISVQLVDYFVVSTNIFSLYGSPVFMTCIAVDQYIAVVHPIKFHAWRKPKYYVFLSVAAWLTMLILSLVVFFLARGQLDNSITCSAQVSAWEQDLVLKLCPEMVVFFIPILILLTCYALSANKLSEVGTGKESMEMMKKKVRRTIWAILALLLICVAPYHVTEMSFILKSLLDPTKETVRWYICNVRPYTWAISFLNTVLNPLLYIFRSKNFQWKAGCCRARQ